MNEDQAKAKQRRKRSARFAEIAIEAGLSEATVDRVLNERGSVSALSRERVVAAAKKLGVTRLLPDVRHGIQHFDCILPVNSSPMHRRLELALERAIQMLDRRIVVHRMTIDHRDVEAFAHAILHPPYRRSGLAVVGSTAPAVTAALRKVALAGEPVVAMVSEPRSIPSAHYVGIDNFVAGQTAGHAVGRLTRGECPVLVLRGHGDSEAHEQRVTGFVLALSALHPAQPCCISDMETRDDADQCFQIVRGALERGTVGAIYNSGDGSEGIYEALRRFGAIGNVIWVGHEMQDHHAQYLQNGSLDLVIDQNPQDQAIIALQHLLFASGFVDLAPSRSSAELQLFIKPNVRTDPYLS